MNKLGQSSAHPYQETNNKSSLATVIVCGRLKPRDLTTYFFQVALKRFLYNWYLAQL